MAVFTHDLIDVTTGVLAATNIMWGGNALQSVTITRNTPHEPKQAVGYLGIVDYTSGQVTSEVTLDTIVTEACTAAGSGSAPGNSVYKYAKQTVTTGTESYALTSFSMVFTAGQPATANYGYLCAAMASGLATLSSQPTNAMGEEAVYAVVMGDDGSGITLVPTFDSSFTPTINTTGVPIITDNGTFATGSISDGGLPAGVQSLNVQCQVNRDHILDVRTAQPIQFVTTYPLTMTADMEVFTEPTSGSGSSLVHGLTKLTELQVQAGSLTKHLTGGGATHATAGKIYVRLIGFMQVRAGESVSVGRYLAHTFNFDLANVVMPATVLS